MIEGRGSGSPGGRDITQPRKDPSTRISKPRDLRPSSTVKPGGARSSAYITEDEQSRQFVADEDKFVLQQAKKKADIRVREGRAKAVDFLAFNLRFIDTSRDDVFDENEADAEIDVPTPEDVIANLGLSDLKELSSDMISYTTLETSGTNLDYWRALQTLCADRRKKLEPQGPEARAVESVSANVDGILRPKTYEQLEALERQIKAKLQSDEDIDPDYWEQLLASLLVWKARAKLRKICEAIKARRVEALMARDPDKARALEQSLPIPGKTPTPREAPTSSSSSGAEAKSGAISSTMSAATQGSSAPPPGTARFAHTANEDFSQATKALYDREVARGIGEDEEIFAAEETVPSGAKPQWADKYRPRKPRYFNRVQMGYDWNKYNQTHYDHDNPPPKVVHGYKFNIFYPDLIDRTKAPTFKMVREHGRKRGESFAPAGEEDTCLIRFIAGPPYEDIAFRIVDREWDYSAKKDRGFKSSFDKVC